MAAENPNEYDDAAFLASQVVMDDAVSTMWDAGAREEDILSTVQNAIENLS